MANNIFIDFLPPWIETGVQPAFYDKESGTVLQQTARMYAKVNEVVQSVNNQNETIADYIEQFNELHDYVHDYFDNLDVQNEINHKLDGLVADGTLELLIGAYIQPRIDAQNTRIDDLQTIVTNYQGSVDAQIGAFNDLVASVTNGSPLVASGVSGMTDTTKVYVNTTDGKWYYYNGSRWTIGGTYQSSGIADSSINITMLGSDVIYNFSTRTNNKDNYLREINVELTNNLINNAISSTTGKISSASLTDVVTNNQLYIPFGYALVVTQNTESYVINAYYYNGSFTYTHSKRIDSGASTQPLISGDYERYVRLRFQKSNSGTIQPSDVVGNVVVKLVERMNIKTNNTIGTNLANPYTALDGYIDNANNPYQYAQNNSYKTFLPIRILKGTTYHVSSFRKLALYDNDLDYITNSFINTATTNHTFTASQDGYLIISAPTGTNVMINSGDDAEDYIPYIESLPEYVQITNTSNLSEIVSSKNILTGKKYVALGDSFTHGDFSNAPEDDYHIEDGTYTGQYKVYPFLIGNRNEMIVTNLAQNGMTMTKISNDWSNYISNGVLANIPSDVDYITIKIGINDNPDHKNATLGTINDDRDDTFYGRYNRVMSYLITNFPDAKIGIIISNGQTSINFVNAAIAIANKYGVPYLNETTDPQVPLLIRTLRSDVVNSVKTARNNYWYVSTTAGSSNSHPNAKCHEYESTIVEDFLRRL